MISASFVKKWKRLYPVDYDEQHYSPFIDKARKGDVVSLRRLTEWKNVGNGPHPMPLSAKKEQAFTLFVKNLSAYRAPGGEAKLRGDFARRAPVFAPFWCHVLYRTPILDVYANTAMIWDTTGHIPSKSTARIAAGSHWQTYDRYSAWLTDKLKAVKKQDPTITERDLDRAIFSWGQAQHGGSAKLSKKRAIPTKGTAMPTTHTSSMAPLRSNRFWDWLQTTRCVPTLSGRFKVKAKAGSTALQLLTGSKNRIRRATVEIYCHDIIVDGAKSQKGDRRYVAALLKAYLEL